MARNGGAALADHRLACLARLARQPLDLAHAAAVAAAHHQGRHGLGLRRLLPTPETAGFGREVRCAPVQTRFTVGNAKGAPPPPRPGADRAQLRVCGRPAVERAALTEVDLARDADLAERVAAAREACIDEGALSFAAAIYFP